MLSLYNNNTIVMFLKQGLSYFLINVFRILCCFLLLLVSEQFLYNFCRLFFLQKELCIYLIFFFVQVIGRLSGGVGAGILIIREWVLLDWGLINFDCFVGCFELLWVLGDKVVFVRIYYIGGLNLFFEKYFFGGYYVGQFYQGLDFK